MVLEGLPGPARGELGRLTQAVDAPLARILGFLLQHLQESGQGVARPAWVKRTTDWAPMVDILNSRQSRTLRSWITVVSVSIIRTLPI